MKKVKSNLVYLDNILEAIVLIQEYTLEKSFDEYVHDQKLSDAVHMRLQLIGENSSKLSVQIREEYPQIPWADIRFLRHIISHDYNIVVPERVWKTIQNDLPVLKKVIEQMIQNEEAKEDAE